MARQTTTEKCPRCQRALNTILTRNALSRVDSSTYVCSSCGVNEAMYNLEHPGEPLPPVNKPVY